MQTVLLAIVFACVAVLVSQQLKKRKPEPPTQQQWTVPQQLDRNDFLRPDAPWLVVLFSSATCDACARVKSMVDVLDSSQVAVATIEYNENKDLHKRYGIDAVPTVVIADHEGVVGSQFVGPPTATDLWAAIAELREPGSTPPPEAHKPIS
jgi:protein-disulfide isomerase